MKRIVDAKLTHFLALAFPGRLHMRSDLHIIRKIWHMGMGVVIATLYIAGVSKSSALLILGSVLTLDIMVESLRLRVPLLNEKIIRIWGPLMRSSEAISFSGVSYYLAATILVIGVFPKHIAILSILYLACGDPIASFFGILYGKYGARFRNGKTLIGTLAGVVVCSIVTFVFLSGFSDFREHLVVLTIAGGILGGGAELLPLEIDDNFSIPLVSGISLWFVFIVLGF